MDVLRDEGRGFHRGELSIEGFEDGDVDTHFLQQLDLLVERRQQLGGAVGPKHLSRMGLERVDDRLTP
jgi:hypothetical protein